jgi:hypothetical protein
MNRSLLLAYQVLVGISDTLTGTLLIVAPELTLGLMHVQAPSDANPYISYLGAFVLSVGLACLYGAALMVREGSVRKLEAVWLLTAITRASVAIVIVAQVYAHALEAGWLNVAAFDAACVLIQAVGLRKGWLGNVAR